MVLSSASHSPARPKEKRPHAAAENGGEMRPTCRRAREQQRARLPLRQRSSCAQPPLALTRASPSDQQPVGCRPLVRHLQLQWPRIRAFQIPIPARLSVFALSNRALRRSRLAKNKSRRGENKLCQIEIVISRRWLCAAPDSRICVSWRVDSRRQYRFVCHITMCFRSLTSFDAFLVT